MKCPNCEFESPPEMRFCGMCGISLTITCPACQFVNPVNYRFCGNCGTPLNPADSARAVFAPRADQTAPAQRAPTPAPVSSQPGASALEVPPTPLVEGERRVATVVFADVKGSTELLESMGTETWVETMNNLFQVIETEVYRFCGEVEQFRGDGLVALFGAKSASEDDPEHAVLAALSIQEAIKPFADDMMKREEIELVVRVGVNTGEIIVTNVGDEQYSEDTAMGEALALASRMETAAEPGTVLVSENTYRLVRESFDWMSLGEINVKGIRSPIHVYRPIAPRRVSDQVAEISQEAQSYGLSLGLIGRKKEYQLLKTSVEDLKAGRGGIVTVTGDKGMGKSFLVNQVRLHYARENALIAAAQSRDLENSPTRERENQPHNRLVRWMHGRCRSYGHLRPYSMWLDLIHEWLGTHPEDQVGPVLGSLRTQMDTQFGIDVEKDYPNLATFLSAPVEESASERSKHSDVEGLKRQFFKTVFEWVRQLSEKSPIVLSFADMQYADTTSLELLEYCLPLCDSLPVLWILVFRPDRDSPIWEVQHHLETEYPHRLVHMNIPPLDEEQAANFIDQFVGQQAFQPQTKQLIIKKAEGNPYFVKELIYSLISQGVLVVDPESNIWSQSRDVTSLDLPDSLQSLLRARIDRLSPNERRILQMAAVIGSVFWLNAIQALTGSQVTMRQLQADMVALQRAGFVHERAFVEDLGMEYAFDSSLIREVAYESLLNAQRVSYHLRVAEYLEEIVFRDGKRRYFNSLAHHYRLAGDVKKELFYSLQAAERAKSIYANAEALHYYSRALDLLEQMEAQLTGNGAQRYAILTQKFEATNGRREVYFLMGNIKAGWEDAKSLLSLARQMSQDPTWLIDALLQQPEVSSADSRDELMQGIPLAEEALQLAQSIGDKRREMNCLLTITGQRNLLNDPTWMEVGDRALALAREIGDRQYEAMILLGIGHAYVGRDELQKGMEYLNQALPICQSIDDRVAEMILLRVLGAQFERSGDHYKRLVEFEQKRLAIAREIGDRLEEGDSLMFCGQIQALNLGDLEGGLNLLQQASNILEAMSGRIFVLLRVAQVEIALGQFENARLTLDEALPLAEKNVFELGRVGHKMVSIILYNALGDLTHLQMALDIVNEILAMEVSQLVSRQYLMAAACEATAVHLGLARIAADQKDREEHLKKALETSQTAVDTYYWFGYVNIIECSCEEVFFRRSQALAANGLVAESAEMLELAYDEMMRKHAFIQDESSFKRTYLENLAIHREIRAAHTASMLTKIDGSRGAA